MNYKKSILVYRCGILLSGLCIVFGLLTKSEVFALIAVVSLVLSFIQLIVFCNCPRCGKGLAVWNFAPIRCSSCGAKLDEAN